jgi:hypothetical protein
LGPVVYFGPSDSARYLRTLAALRREELGGLPPAVARQIATTKAMAWDDLAEPRALMTELAQEAGLRIVGFHRVPHDLWAAASLPPLAWTDRLTLLAVQFDLTFRVASDGKGIELVPIPADVAIVRSYDAGRDAQAVAKQYAARAPEAEISVSGNKVVVRGLVEDHERITAARPPAATPTSTRPPREVGRTVIEKLSVKSAPLVPLLERLAAQLDLDLQLDRQAIAAAGISLDQPVSVELKNAQLEEVFREVLRSTSLQFRIRGNVLEVGPKER